jgi:hypothetical protein
MAPIESQSLFRAAFLTSNRYVLDGNALGLTATEAIRRRRPVEFNQPDTIIVSLGYPADTLIPDSPYSTHRSYDYQPPVCATCPPAPAPGVPSNADNFIQILDTVIRPWVKNTVFPEATFSRDALYGHSFGGLFVLYAMIKNPQMFDTFLSSSPALFWNNGYILNQTASLKAAPPANTKFKKPAFQLSWGTVEQFPIKRRTETQAEFEFRKSIITGSQMTTYCTQLLSKLNGAQKLRDVSGRVYPFTDHSAVGGAAFMDGIDYFLDW